MYFATGDVSGQVSEKLLEASKLADSGRYEESLESYLQAIQMDENNPTSWYCLGVIHHNLGNISESVESFQKSDELFPNHGATLANLAILLENKDLTSASEYASKAIIHFPDNSKLVALSKIQTSVADPPEKLFIEAKPIVDDSIVRTEQSLQDANLVDGESSIIAEAKSLTNTGEHSKAVSLWKGLLEGSPNSPEVWRGLASALDSAGYPDRAEQCRKRAENIDDSIENITIEVEEEMNSTEKLIEIAESIHHSESNFEEDRGDFEQSVSWYNMAINLLNEGKNEESISTFEKCIGGCPMGEIELKVKAHNGRGNALYNSGRYSESVIAYHTAISLDPQNVTGKTLFNMGSSYAAVEMFNDAIKCFTQSLERGLDKEQTELCEKQISRCRLLSREQSKRQSKL
ncbi:MAG: hypothetical protein CMB61_01415 [Euryarchaeota archaeon]|mgnify:FL=1|nr:hypothetical protein [Euryarchaeota archaeon]